MRKTGRRPGAKWCKVCAYMPILGTRSFIAVTTVFGGQIGENVFTDNVYTMYTI